jgi:hypothetical protein
MHARADRARLVPSFACNGVAIGVRSPDSDDAWRTLAIDALPDHGSATHISPARAASG